MGEGGGESGVAGEEAGEQSGEWRNGFDRLVPEFDRDPGPGGVEVPVLEVNDATGGLRVERDEQPRYPVLARDGGVVDEAGDDLVLFDDGHRRGDRPARMRQAVQQETV